MIDNLSRGFQVSEEGLLEGSPVVPEPYCNMLALEEPHEATWRGNCWSTIVGVWVHRGLEPVIRWLQALRADH